MLPETLVLIDCRRLARIEAARLAKRLSAAEPGIRLVALVPAGELSCGWIGFAHVITELSALEQLEKAS